MTAKEPPEAVWPSRARSTNEIDALRRELDETNRGVLALYDELDAHARRLAEADRKKDEFIAMLAHELRNPLAVAALAVEELDAEQRPVAILERQIQHLTRLVNDLLEVSRVARGKLSLDLAPLDLGALVEENLADFVALLERTGHQVGWTPPTEPVVVEGDAVRLTQILHNLLHNSAKYSPSGSTVAVRLTQDEHSARLTVRDEGRGLSDSERKRIFDMFVQTHDDDDVGGLGIGLSLVRQLVRLQGGRAEVYSAGRGKGSTFEIVLPRSHAEMRAPAPRPSARPIAARRVLLVDDEDDLRDLLAARLAQRGLDVEVAEDAEDALERLEEQEVDLVLSDIGLPGMDGRALAEEIRLRHPDLPMIALSGYGAAKDIEDSLAAGFAAHLVKPVKVDRLMETIAQVVDRDPDG